MNFKGAYKEKKLRHFLSIKMLNIFQMAIKRWNKEKNEGDGDGLKVESSSYLYMSRMLVAFCQFGKCKP